jgi:photosystem II stability/assembly factor-like uncharacterized protein
MTASDRLRNLVIGALGACLLGAGITIAQQGPPGGPRVPLQPEPLRFRYMGPPSAGRIAAVAGVPGDPSTYYAGAASGGIWKTADGGRTFEPIFDDQPVQAIGALAVAPSNPRIVWAGTGEAWAIRDSDVMGDGIYKSVDGGASWRRMGLGETGRIGRILVHPTNPDIVYVCALGRATGPQPERGVFKTTDGGATWARSLFVDADTGCSGLSMDARNPDVLFAGTWQVVMHTWAMFSGGPGSGVYVTRDAGATWTRAQDGLPKSPVGKIDVAVAPSDARRVYALIQTSNQGSLWRSDDGGTKWSVVSWDRRLIGRAGYYIRVAVSPANPDEVLVANSSFHRSTDGGRTFPPGGPGGCGDCHDIWIDPKNADHWAATGDGGMGITTNHGASFTSVALPIGQMYHVAVDTRVPYWIYSNRQDDGTMRGSSESPVPVPNVPSYAGITRVGSGLGTPAPGGRGGFGGPPGAAGEPWDQGLGGCESGFTIPDPTDADIVWASCYGNEVSRFDARARRARSVSPWIHTLDSAPTDVKYRCHWTPPLAIDPFDHNTVYYGCQLILKTSNGGQTWTEFSPDLSTKDPSRIVSSGGVVGDNLGQFYGEVVFAIAPSSIQQGLIWAGTNDGKVWYTRDGGASWNDVTKNITGLPAWGTVRKIEPSPFDAGTAYVVVDFHLMDDRRPYIYKTADYGQTWTRISDSLPTGHPLDYAMSVAENPNRRGMLFAGTGHAFYYSLNDGGQWTRFAEGLPAAPVTWIVVEPRYHDVVVSTYGRGLFILRDITRLEQSDRMSTDSTTYLYEPRTAFRLARSGTADFLYFLKSPPQGRARAAVLDASGAVVRTLPVTPAPGLNRLTWDLRYDPPRRVELRTLPPDNPHIWEEARFKGRDTRPIIHWGIEQAATVGPLAAPGAYTLRLNVDGQTLTRAFTVTRDPAIRTSDADLALSTATQRRIRDGMNDAVDLVNRLELMRKQLEDQGKADKLTAEARAALSAMNEKLLGVELRLLTKTELHSDDKWYVESYKVYMNLVWLNGVVGTGAGDVAGGADQRPTDASLQILDAIENDLAAAKSAFADVLAKDVPAFNRDAGRHRLKPLDTGPSKPTATESMQP